MNYLKKNNNEHFTYNLGVTMFRLALVFFILATILLTVRLFNPPKPFKEIGYQTLSISEVRKEQHTTRRRSRKSHTRRTYYTYHATFIKEDGEKFHQKLDKNEYQFLSGCGSEITRPLYLTHDGDYYMAFSREIDGAKAAKDYYKRFPTYSMSLHKWSIIVGYGLALLNISSGITEIKKSRKYRKPYVNEDGSVNQTLKNLEDAKDAYTDKLNKEFNLAATNGSEFNPKLADFKSKHTPKEKPKSETYEERAARDKETEAMLDEFDRILKEKGDFYKYKE